MADTQDPPIRSPLHGDPSGAVCIATLKPELTVSATLTLPIAGARRRNLLSDCAIECQLFTVSNLPRRTTSPQITHRPQS